MTDNATSKDAYESVNFGELERRILGFMQEREPVACFEVEEQLGISHQTASASICYLRRYQSKVYAVGQKVNPRTGRRWNTYRIVDDLFEAKLIDPKCGDNGMGISKKDFVGYVNTLTEDEFRELVGLTKFRQ